MLILGQTFAADGVGQTTFHDASGVFRWWFDWQGTVIAIEWSTTNDRFTLPLRLRAASSSRPATASTLEVTIGDADMSEPYQLDADQLRRKSLPLLTTFVQGLVADTSALRSR